MKEHTEASPQFRVNQPVEIAGRDALYIISAVYRLENIFVYELAGLPDFYVRERRLKPSPLDAAA